MSDIIKVFVEDARAVTIHQAALALKLKFKQTGVEHPQPCPISGGKDRFSFNTAKNEWVCRHCGTGGHDGIGMAAHCHELDLHRRRDFLEACSLVLGRPIPDEVERESDEERAAREKRIAERKEETERLAAQRAAEQHDYREAERGKARGIYHAMDLLVSLPASDAGFYLTRRCAAIPNARYLRCSPRLTYWHGQDARGGPRSLFEGPAMGAPFMDRNWQLIGCHLTWIDLGRAPKYRPVLYGVTGEGAKVGLAPWEYGDRPPSRADMDADFYEVLPTKKMRGSKKGGVIPLAGRPSSPRWVGGEGIENGLAFAAWEGFRADTFYFAAGDLGNLAGPAANRFAHPTLTKADRNGVQRPVMVPGDEPRTDAADDAMWIADEVKELVLLGDSDSEPVFTAAAMQRARRRHARPGRTIPIVWPPARMDFSKLAMQGMQEGAA